MRDGRHCRAFGNRIDSAAAMHSWCRRWVIFGNDDAHPPSVGLPSKADQRVRFYRIKDDRAAAFGVPGDSDGT